MWVKIRLLGVWIFWSYGLGSPETKQQLEVFGNSMHFNYLMLEMCLSHMAENYQNKLLKVDFSILIKYTCHYIFFLSQNADVINGKMG